MGILLYQYDHVRVVGKFNSGDELLSYNHLSDIDLILMDIEMPGLDGFETVTRLSAAQNSIKMIGVSVHQESQYIEKFIAPGFSCFVSKTRLTEELYEVINRVRQNEQFFLL